MMDMSKKYRKQKDGVVLHKMGGAWHRRLLEVTNGMLAYTSAARAFARTHAHAFA